MAPRNYILLLLSLLLLSCSPISEENKKEEDPKKDPLQTEIKAGTELTLAFYNLENLFDTEDHPQTDDQDFLPDGRYQWTSEKLDIKIANLAKVISQLGEGGPQILGVAEVENREVLQQLARHPLISQKNYQIVHEESPDTRGIDVGLLYDPDYLSIDAYQALTIEKKGDPYFRTRDILMASGKVNGQELHIFVNHWPSRREGQEASEPNRLAAAKELKSQIDLLIDKNPDAGIIVMGDFNDNPTNKSLAGILDAEASISNLEEDQLFNPMAGIFDPSSMGSLTYQGQWDLFDQILLSEDLIDGEHALSYLPNSVKVFNEELVRVPNRQTRFVPRRAIFRGEFQDNGFSDHFPVYIKLNVNP